MNKQNSRTWLLAEGIDLLSTQLQTWLDDTTLAAYINNLTPNAAFGNVYWVDKNTGDDGNDGLTSDAPFETIGRAITVSNLEVGSYNMNTIYVNAQTYTEDLTVFPKNANVIAIGAKVRLQGIQSCPHLTMNCHFYNFQFRYSTGTMITIATTCYGVGFHGCTFDNTGSTIALSVASTQDFVVEDCRFIGNPIFTTAITSTARQIRFLIRRNQISATTNGILIAAADDGYQNVIADNYIGRVAADPNSGNQMTYGIRLAKTTGSNAYMLVNNRIEAVDAISWGVVDQASANNSISNAVVEAGTGVMEDPLT